MKKDTAVSHRKRDRICLICGDKSIGYNFGAVSCESCKAFFRRNAKKNNVADCIFENKCVITLKTRKFCSACRLKKCFTVGMKESAILDDGERKARQEKVRANREKRHVVRDLTSQSPESGSVSSCGNKSIIVENPCSTGQPSSAVGSTNHTPWSKTTHEEDLSSAALSAASAYTCQAMTYGQEEEDIFIVPGSPNDEAPRKLISLNEILTKCNAARLLTLDQWNAINDLRQAYESSFLSYDQPPKPDFTLSNLVNTSGFIVRKLITFAKKLSDFSNLPKEAQVALLKGVVLSTLFLRSASYYDVERDVWITPNGYIPTSILTDATGLTPLYEEHSKYCRTFRSVVGHDNTVIALMQTLCLFSPERERLLDRQHVVGINDRYVLLLKHYLEAQYGYVKARTALCNVLANLNELQELTDRHGTVLWRVDPTTIDPLMLEVFSLNEVHMLSDSTTAGSSLPYHHHHYTPAGNHISTTSSSSSSLPVHSSHEDDLPTFCDISAPRSKSMKHELTHMEQLSTLP